MPSLAHISDASGSVAISAALLDPDDQSRREVADALTAFHGASVRESIACFEESLRADPRFRQIMRGVGHGWR